MTSTTEPAVAALNLRYEERTYPPYDPFHGTNAAMLWRRVTITTRRGTAHLEQTDYGHPGRLNDWQFRGIDAALQPRSQQLIALADAATAVQ
jgi:hypothetical protein